MSQHVEIPDWFLPEGVGYSIKRSAMNERELAIERVIDLMKLEWKVGRLEQARRFNDLASEYEQMTDEEFNSKYRDMEGSAC